MPSTSPSHTSSSPRRRFVLEGLVTRLTRADAERLPLADASFDAVYSFGVLHHTPDTQAAIDEVHRMLRPASPSSASFGV